MDIIQGEINPGKIHDKESILGGKPLGRENKGNLIDKGIIKKTYAENFVKSEMFFRENAFPVSKEAPPGLPLGIRFVDAIPSNKTTTAGYDAIGNCIIVCPLIFFGSSESQIVNAQIEATLRHEKSHAVFSSLSGKDQSRVADIFLQHPKLLGKAYWELRGFGYTAGYFIIDAGDINYFLKARELGRSVKTERFTAFEMPQGTKKASETVNAVIVAEEILGWIQNLHIDPETEHSYHILQASRSFLQAFTPEEKQLLNELGLLEIDVSELLSRLQRDTRFVSAQQKARESMAIAQSRLAMPVENMQKT